MTVLMIGAQLGAVPDDDLDRLALDPAAEDRLAADLSASGVVDGVFVLSTCQRTEVYVSTGDPLAATAVVERAWTAATGRDRGSPAGVPCLRTGADAAAHLFAVVGGRRSATPGETHVVDQVRGALSRAQHRGRLGGELNSLVQQSLRTGRRMRALDGPTGGDDLADRALQVALARHRPGPGTRVLVVGAGTVGREAATAAARRGTDVTVLSRTTARARLVAEEVGGRCATGSLGAALVAAEVVVTATSSPAPLIDLTAARTALRARDGRPQVYVDLARPRDVVTTVARLPGVQRIGLSDLLVTGQEPRCSAVAESDAADWERTRRAAAAGPVVRALRDRAMEAVEDEVRRVTRPSGSPEDAEVLRRSLRRVVNRLLHTPMERARAHAADGTLARYELLLDDLFTPPGTTADRRRRLDRNPEEVTPRREQVMR
ncbi:NAD-binding protein [Isoptericola sp. b515]|uniref:NAD(P)-binding domain-containing protein n=1 Tax=Isoptericola sp. b515 TaxID=3064652 RepID=UPI002713E568|nr:NAD(P)-binding domain-containing protein [Isoptericola sp. b515]MDO8147743.1 NAD-binding protein [Isoptericola sp. b515]